MSTSPKTGPQDNPNEEEESLPSLRARWTHLYASHLPALARARDPVQSHWPVHLDHCFARIILDNAVGVDRPWTEVVKAPAVRNMSVAQLNAAVALGERVARGEVGLGGLDGVSLGVRGKTKGGRGREGVVGGKRKAEEVEEGVISKYFKPVVEVDGKKMKRVKREESAVEGEEEDLRSESGSKDSAPTVITTATTTTATTKDNDNGMTTQIRRIQSSTTLTPFRKQTLTLLCHIPPGRWSTYQAMSDYISATSHKTCARAVGNAMRNNPFAPEVPCHRILSSDGTIGGFGGDWGEEGRFAGEKRRLLGEEGVSFDGRGRVVGRVFREFGG